MPTDTDPRAEAKGIVGAIPTGLGTATMIKGAGQYPHAQTPDAVAGLVTSFIRRRAPGLGKRGSLVESQQHEGGETP